MEIEIRGQHFRLLPQKAMLWLEKKMLLVADLHLGKVTYFRKAGIAIPSSAAINNFQRLDEILITNDVERIIFLGDLFHNQYNEEWIQFTTWRNKFQNIPIITVLGNHDILPKELFEDIQIQIDIKFLEGEFCFTHHPVTDLSLPYYTFCGHIHPVYCLRSSAYQSLRLPCFVIDEHQTILPGFGVFTGGYEVKTAERRRIFIVAEKKLMEV